MKCYAVLHDHHDDPPDSALSLRFLGAVHRFVLQGKAPQLASCCRSARGDGYCDDLWPAFHAVMHQPRALLRELLGLPVQANEGGRCAALLGGFLEVVRRICLPLRPLEVGAAGGLILRWDQYRYEAGDEGWADPYSSVRLCGAFGDVHPPFDEPAKIAGRRGRDALPIDPCTEEGRLTLTLRLEPADNITETRLQFWPSGEDRQLARSVFHGKSVQWLARENWTLLTEVGLFGFRHKRPNCYRGGPLQR